MQENQGTVNRRVLLSRRPVGIPQASDFVVDSAPVPKAGPGQVVVRNEWLSVEPAMRGWVNAAQNYSDPVPIGAVMRAFAAGRIVESHCDQWPVGVPVTGMFGWQEYALLDPKAIKRRIEEDDLPLSTSLGVLGLNGVTAHYGIFHVLKPLAGQTVVVSTAAGSVGSCAGQIAKILGCRTVGITGGEAKVRLCTDHFGFDVALDYKSKDFEQHLAQACPDGVDAYFDCTSGPVTDAVMQHLAIGARVAVCGTVSIPNWDPPPLGPRMERTLLVKRARIEGFVILDHADKDASARADLANWIRQGKLKYLEDISEGIESAPDSIAGLYRGENMGKRLIRLV
ncbi:NADP-dependent oxidoreductase [Castellaniella sp.]|uniref:NADP-dependent oxidoreductase n=1 Tax=Castellaniella sp. TaxID=1955812 RepID=UPI0035643027